MRSGGPTSEISSTSASGTAAIASLLAGEVEVLDLRGRGLEAEALRVVVVEVLAPRAHAADVERELRFSGMRQRRGRRRG